VGGARAFVRQRCALLERSGARAACARQRAATLERSGTCPGWNTKKTFPLMCDRLHASVFADLLLPARPGYAVTGHSAQGATLRGKVLIDMMSCFACGLL
jgi:hypothetical protein